jgi:hypothetical protein
MSLLLPATRISIILGIIGFVLVIFLLLRGRIALWWRNHSHDVPLEQAYIALKDEIKDPAFNRNRIAEFYVLVGGGIALSILIYVYAEDMPTFNTTALVFWYIFVCSSIGFAAVAVVGAWAFKRKALKVLLSLRFFTGLLVMWMLVYFISYTIWPLYLLRYAYDMAGAGFLLVVYPDSQMIVEFPWFGIVWHGELYQFSISVSTVHPLLWGAFVGIGLFIPGQSVASKVKKGGIIFLIDHAFTIFTILIELILHIETGFEFSELSRDVAFAITAIIGAVWRVIAIFVLYPDTRTLARSVFHGALKTDPVHAVFPNHVEDKIKRQLIADGGHELGGNDELKQINQRWGIALKIDDEHELHVRARGHGPDQFSLSAHYEYGRDSGKHLMAAGDYKRGKRILLEYLARKGFGMPSE